MDRSSGQPKRIRVRSAYEVTATPPSTIRLRPRANSGVTSSPSRRRSYRIVSRGSESAPSIIRVTREPSLSTTLENTSVALPSVHVETVTRDNQEPVPVEIIAEPIVIDLDAQTSPTPSRPPPPPPPPMSISSGDSFEDTLSSSSSMIDDDDDEDSVDSHYVPDYVEFLSEWIHDRNSVGDQEEEARVAQLVSVPTELETHVDRPELIEVLKFHSGRCKCIACHRLIAAADICVDFRLHSAGAAIKHCHFGCVDNNLSLFLPVDERLIRFDPQFSQAEKTSYLNSLRSRLPSRDHSRQNFLFPLVRVGDPDRRIQRQRDFINQELQRRNRVQQQARRAIEARRYIDSRRHILSQISMTTHFGGYNSHIGPPPTYHNGLSRNVLYSLPRMHVPRTSESDDNIPENCVICLEDLLAGEEILILPCFHKFHSKCIESWFANSKLCPIDKLDIEQLYHRTGHSQDVPPFLMEPPSYRAQHY